MNTEVTVKTELRIQSWLCYSFVYVMSEKSLLAGCSYCFTWQVFLITCKLGFKRDRMVCRFWCERSGKYSSARNNSARVSEWFNSWLLPFLQKLQKPQWALESDVLMSWLMCLSVLHKVYINPMVVCVHCICTHTEMSNRLIKAKIKCNILTFFFFF